MKLVVLTADDLGVCEATNRAINRAFREGVLTSASLMANGPAFEHAVEEVVKPNPRLAVGLHLCLTSGLSVLPPKRVPSLVDKQGRLHHGFTSLCRLLVSRRATALGQIEDELDAQFRRAAATGLTLDHVDAHRHVHMIPGILTLVTRLAKRHGCMAIRVPDEPIGPIARLLRPDCLGRSTRNLPKKLVLSILARVNRPRLSGFLVPDRVFGILDSGRMSGAILARILRDSADGLTEVITHPGTAGATVPAEINRQDQHFVRSRDRERELHALLDPMVRETIGRNRISLVCYGDVVKQRESVQV